MVPSRELPGGTEEKYIGLDQNSQCPCKDSHLAHADYKPKGNLVTSPSLVDMYEISEQPAFGVQKPRLLSAHYRSMIL